jgi:hypothetical protein
MGCRRPKSLLLFRNNRPQLGPNKEIIYPMRSVNFAMNKSGKYLSSCLIVILVASSSLVIQSTSAQSTFQKPITPEFTLTFNPISETLTHVDPLSGAKTYEVVDKSIIEVKIKNQPFQENIGGTNYYLYYAIFVAGHFDPSNQSYWQYAYNFPTNYTTTMAYKNTLEATKSEYTTASIWAGDYPTHSQIDVTVSSMLMHDGQFRVYNYLGDLTGHIVSGVVEGEYSGTTQTYTIPDHQTSIYSIPNPSSATTSLMPNPTTSPTEATTSLSPVTSPNTY